MKMTVGHAVRLISTLKPELRAQRYDLWKRNGFLKPEEVDALEKIYPRVARGVKPAGVVPGEKKSGIGLGDAIKAVTDILGIKQCGGCKKRQETLNKIRIG